MGGRPRLTLADFETAGAKINLKWLGTELPGARAKTLWECLTCGKTCSIKYTHVNDGHGCRKCRDAKRKKPDDYRELGVKTGFEWLGPEVMTTSQETSWRCPICGKPFPASYSHIRQGLGHKRCTRNQLTPSRLRAAAKAKDFIWLGTEPGKRKTLERWKCRKCGRPFRASYDAVVRKRRCAYCPKPAERLRTPPAKYKALAEGTGLIWLGPPVQNIRIETQWKCKRCGHEWYQTYLNLEAYPTCPRCSPASRRKTEADYLDLARKRGLRCLDPKVKNTRVQTSWSCPFGHVFLASYAVIRHGHGNGCRLCDRKRKSKPAQKYADLAAQFPNLAWLGPEVTSIDSMTWWECTRGKKHRYQATFRRVRDRQGRCQICKQLASGERAGHNNKPEAEEDPTKLARAARAHPVNREIDYSREEVDFMREMQAWSSRTGVRHPSWKEVFAVLIAVGYVLTEPSGGEPGSEAAEFEAAMEKHKQTSGRLFPTWKQVLTVFRALGYELPSVGKR
jgi:rubrerythrin